VLGQYWYFQIFRKSVISFATLFNNIMIKRIAKPNVNAEETLETLKVPIQFGPYAKFLARIAVAPEDQRQSIAMSLPRMSFEIKGLHYDGSRKVVPTQFMKILPSDDSKTSPTSGVQMKQYMPVPYNLDMDLNIMANTAEDCFQIMEQILPNFHPSINVPIRIIDETKEERDIAVVLNGVSYLDDYEGDMNKKGTTVWTLSFTVKTYLFGPIDAQKDIRKIAVNYGSAVGRPASLRYSAEAVSTATPPVPTDQINVREGEYTVVESIDDMYAAENSFFGVDL
jgi:hypothetical protein